MLDVETRRSELERRFPAWPGWTLASALDAAAAEYPDRPFVIAEDRECTYAELAERSARLARGLVAEGIAAGHNVALLLPNGADFVTLVFAIARAGAVAVPVNALLHERELGYVLEQSDSVALVTCERYRDLDHAAHLDALVPGWRDGRGSGALRLVVSIDEGGRPLDSLERPTEPSLDAELARRAAVAQPTDPATIFYTSGTTGLPKGVVLTHDMELRSAYGSALTRAFEDGRRILFALPLNHVFAYIEGMLAALWVGGTIVVQSRFDPVDTLRAIERHRVNEALFVPTMSLAVVDAALGGDYDTSSLHTVMSAAAAAPARLWDQLTERLGLSALFTAYGMTETAAAVTFTFPGDPMERLVGTVGRTKLGGVAGDHLTVRFVDPFSGEDVGVDEDGELCVRGLTITEGYYRKPEETAAATYPGGWLRSGDLGRMDAEGYVRLTGRSKDLYKCGGETVMPTEVEAHLTEHPDVAQAYVIPLPDERMGEVGCAYVVAAEGRTPDPDALIEHCRAGLARFKVPVRVELIGADELPLTASGKVQKFRLVELARDQGDAADHAAPGQERQAV